MALGKPDSAVSIGDVFDIHGALTGISTRVVYRVATKEKFLWAHHGGSNGEGDQDVQSQPRGNGGSEWHKNSNECEWSVHEVPGSSNPKKYYIVTKGRVLCAAHGASATAIRWTNYHNVLTRSKTGGSEWHRCGPEAQWTFEARGNGFFRITTSHKVLWASDKDVHGMNIPSEGGNESHFNSDDCKWEFVPKMASYSSRLYDFDYVTPGEFSGPVQPNWKADTMIDQSYNNPATSHTKIVNTFEKTGTYTNDSEFSLENTASITLKNSASVKVEGKIPGLGDAGSTVESGMELTESITLKGAFRWQSQHTETIKLDVEIAPGASGRVVAVFYKGPFNLAFNCKVDLKASVKIAPSDPFAVEDPNSRNAQDEMLKALLHGVGFNESSTIKDINYSYDTCTFVNSGTMRGETGVRSNVDVVVSEGPKPTW